MVKGLETFRKAMADRVLVFSARPTRVKREFPIHLTLAGRDGPIARRNAPEFYSYFNQIWKELDTFEE